MSYKIEKGIKYPSKRNKYPFREMKVGDSFFVKLKEGNKITSLQAQMGSLAKSFSNVNENDWVFKTSKMEDGVRVWRSK